MASISFEITGEDTLLESLRAKTDRFTAALIAKVDLLDAILQAKIQAKLEGPVLQHRTGNLVRSIEMIPAKLEGDNIVGAVQGGGGVAFYGRFQEYGTRGPYQIVATNKKALHFLIGGKDVFAKRVTHPGLQGKNFMGGTAEEMRQEILDGLQATVNEVASE